MQQPVGKILKNHLLAPYTSWRIGGPAELFYQPSNLMDLQNFLLTLTDSNKIYWLGAGSNVLIADAGLAGTVIRVKDCLNLIENIDEQIVRVEAGVSCQQFANYCKQNSYVSGAFLAGIPGTIGGAIAMNAGAFGGETWQLLRQVETINCEGQIKIRPVADFTVGYRHVVIPDGEWFVAGYFQLQRGDYAAVAAEIQQLMAKRRTTQPLNEFSCGSVFRNPPGDHAARLIDACDLKGEIIGDAQVSTKHANFIINRGRATAAEVKQLMVMIQSKVQIKFGIELVPEVKIWE